MADYDLAGLTLPYSAEAEQSVIGAILIDEDIFGEINQVLKVDQFYSDINRGVFEVFVNLYNTSTKIDIVTVIDECLIQGVFENETSAKTFRNERRSKHKVGNEIRLDNSREIYFAEFNFSVQRNN